MKSRRENLLEIYQVHDGRRVDVSAPGVFDGHGESELGTQVDGLKNGFIYSEILIYYFNFRFWIDVILVESLFPASPS